MKKIIALLAACVFICSLTACGGKDDKSDRDTADSVSESQNGAADDDTADESFDKYEFLADNLKKFNKNAVIEETVMYDENNVKITASNVEYTDYSIILNIIIENNSDKALSFISGSLGYSCNYVNKYMVEDGYLNCDVAAGKKANDKIEFGYENLQLYGINEIAEFGIGFDISDDEYNHTYSGPIQLKTSAYDSHDFSQDSFGNVFKNGQFMKAHDGEVKYFSDDVVYDENGVKVISNGVMKNTDGDEILVLELENTGSETVNVSVSDISANGLLLNSSLWSSDTVNAGKRAVMDINISDVLDTEYWSAFGIEEIGNISVSLSQKDAEWSDIGQMKTIEIVIPGADGKYDPSGNEVYNNNGVRIVSKAIVDDAHSYSNDVNVLMLVENNSGKTINVDDVYNSVSVNGVMTDYTFYSKEIESGKSAAFMINLQDSSLSANNISSAADINDVEISLEIKEDYNVIDAPTISITG